MFLPRIKTSHVLVSKKVTTVVMLLVVEKAPETDPKDAAVVNTHEEKKTTELEKNVFWTKFSETKDVTKKIRPLTTNITGKKNTLS